MSFKKYLLIVATASITLLGHQSTIAGTYLGAGQVLKVFTDSNSYGGCLDYIAFDPSFASTGCDNFVSFGCDGQFISKSQANTNFSMAQLALVTGVTVNIFADTTKTYNGSFCLADRIDVAAP
ncbi:hypothetical protein ACYVVD_02675 [Arenicellales bacterium IMCC58067]